MNATSIVPFPVALVAFSALVAGCGTGASSSEDGRTQVTSSNVVASSDIARIALANLNRGACSVNSAGTSNFAASCHGNGGQPEYWCADFARWVWAEAGASNTGELTAAAGSFYTYGQRHGTLHQRPTVGDAVVFNYAGGGYADHVALVSKVNADGTVETVSGDWGGQDGSEAYFSSTSHVILNAPAYRGAVGSYAGIMGMTISGFISPVGLNTASPPPPAAGPTTPTAPAPSACGTIKPGEGLTGGHAVKSCSGEYSLAMQLDGNFVLYHGPEWLWQSGTAGSDGTVAVMQTDGNLVVYGRTSNPLWNSQTDQHFEGVHLDVQDDGNVVLYTQSGAVLWDTATNGR